MFNYELLPRTELEADITDQGRVYFTPAGTFRSVTTILKEKLDNSKLEEWKKRVGEEEAERISTQARLRGDWIHSTCERYLKGDPQATRGLMPSNKDMFLRVKSKLDARITKIYGIEFPLFSTTLKTAGRTDGIVEWIGHNAILDFKTARRQLKKGDDRLAKYFLQCTVYAMMVEENYPVKIPYNVIVVLPADHDDPQILVKTNAKYRPIVMELFK